MMKGRIVGRLMGFERRLEIKFWHEPLRRTAIAEHNSIKVQASVYNGAAVKYSAALARIFVEKRIQNTSYRSHQH